jgi:hypothetical protein
MIRITDNALETAAQFEVRRFDLPHSKPKSFFDIRLGTLEWRGKKREGRPCPILREARGEQNKKRTERNCRGERERVRRN